MAILPPLLPSLAFANPVLSIKCMNDFHTIICTCVNKFAQTGLYQDAPNYKLKYKLAKRHLSQFLQVFLWLLCPILKYLQFILTWVIECWVLTKYFYNFVLSVIQVPWILPVKRITHPLFKVNCRIRKRSKTAL